MIYMYPTERRMAFVNQSREITTLCGLLRPLFRLSIRHPLATACDSAAAAEERGNPSDAMVAADVDGGADDDVMILDPAELRPPRPQRRRSNRMSIPCELSLLLIEVSYTDLGGQVVVVDLLSDDEGDDEPIANDPEPPLPPVCSLLNPINDQDDF
jgi:hypothetical protein